MITSVNPFSRMYSFSIIITMASVLGLGILGCTKEQHKESIRTVIDEEAELFEKNILDELSITTEVGLEVSLWASETLLGDPVGINFDNEGRAWIATTTRRRKSITNAEAISHWDIDNLSWRSLEDMREFLHREMVPENGEENTWLQDFNEDGNTDWRDMTVEGDSVFMFEDLSRNGYAIQARVMDWDFYSVITEDTGSVLHHEGELFVVCAPDVLRIQDSNDDGKWDSA